MYIDNGALSGGRAEPARRLDETLQYAVAAFVGPPQPQLRLGITALAQGAEHRRSVRVATLAEQRLGPFERRRPPAAEDFRQESVAHAARVYTASGCTNEPPR